LRYSATAITQEFIAGGTAGTPWFHINGIDMASGGNSPSLEDWIEVLDPLINTAVNH
jgi:hypothetical protein